MSKRKQEYDLILNCSFILFCFVLFLTFVVFMLLFCLQVESRPLRMVGRQSTLNSTQAICFIFKNPHNTAGYSGTLASVPGQWLTQLTSIMLEQQFSNIGEANVSFVSVKQSKRKIQEQDLCEHVPKAQESSSELMEPPQTPHHMTVQQSQKAMHSELQTQEKLDVMGGSLPEHPIPEGQQRQPAHTSFPFAQSVTFPACAAVIPENHKRDC